MAIEGANMAIVLTKKKLKVQPVETEMISDFAELIDEIGAMQAEQTRIEQQIKELQKRQKPYKEKLKSLCELLQEVDEHDDDAKFVELGVSFQAEFGKKATSRSIRDIEKVRQLMGDATFFKLCSVTLKAIDDYLTPEEKAAVLEIERTVRGVEISKRP
jgi:hypothetical protein